MKMSLVISFVAMVLGGCGFSGKKAVPSKHHITLYSGGWKVFEDDFTGEMSKDGDGVYYFKSGTRIHVFGSYIISSTK